MLLRLPCQRLFWNAGLPHRHRACFGFTWTIGEQVSKRCGACDLFLMLTWSAAAHVLRVYRRREALQHPRTDSPAVVWHRGTLKNMSESGSSHGAMHHISALLAIGKGCAVLCYAM